MGTLKHVEHIRGRLIRGLVRELSLLRGFVSMTEGNQPAVDRLHGAPGNELVGKLTVFVLEHLGHEVQSSLEDSNSKVRRAVAGVSTGETQAEPDAGKGEGRHAGYAKPAEPVKPKPTKQETAKSGKRKAA